MSVCPSFHFLCQSLFICHPYSSDSEFTESDSDSEREELEADGEAGSKLMTKIKKRRRSEPSDPLSRVMKVRWCHVSSEQGYAKRNEWSGLQGLVEQCL